jgi:DHA2 family multidrug resistance protein
VSLLEPATRDRLAELQQHFMADGLPSAAEAWHRAVVAVGETVREQASIMGYADCFALLGAVLLVAILPVVLMRKGSASTGAAH